MSASDRNERPRVSYCDDNILLIYGNEIPIMTGKNIKYTNYTTKRKMKITSERQQESRQPILHWMGSGSVPWWVSHRISRSDILKKNNNNNNKQMKK